jgi:hypothetical protein
MPMQRLSKVVSALRNAPPRSAEPEADHPRPPPSDAPSVEPVSVHHCSFCGGDENDTWQIVAGGAGYICGDCVFRACEAMAEGGSAIPSNRLRKCLVAWERVGTWLLAQRRGER